MTTLDGIVQVMVVDDQAPFRAAARDVVDRTKGFAVVAEAESGEEAIERADELQPDVILMDINMGAVDGIEAASRITASHPDIVVVLVSTYELDDLPLAARTSGAVAYVKKDDFGGRLLRRLWETSGDDGFRP